LLTKVCCCRCSAARAWESVRHQGISAATRPNGLPRLNEITVSWDALCFALVATVASTIFGLAPALHAGQVDVMSAVKSETRGSTGSGRQTRTRRILVVTEFAVARADGGSRTSASQFLDR
jgi:hypothetical protein